MPEHTDNTDSLAWLAELAASHVRELKAYLGRFSTNPADLEDWTQEALLRVCAASRERELDEPRAYLFRTARNVALNRLERRRVRQASHFDVELMTRQRGERPPMHRMAQTGREIDRLVQAIEALPARCREAFVLCKLHGFSHREIAEILGISTSTVEKHLIKGFRSVRAQLVGEAGPAAGESAEDAGAAGARETRA